MKGLIQTYGSKKWSSISRDMKLKFPEIGRSGKQCRERWHNHLKPEINKKGWSEEELKIIFECHRKFGNKWT
jgi:hypothetical protein